MGAELWGFQERKFSDRFKFFFCKYVLGVGKYVSSNAILAECGRTGICVDYFFKCVTYWWKS